MPTTTASDTAPGTVTDPDGAAAARPQAVQPHVETVFVPAHMVELVDPSFTGSMECCLWEAAVAPRSVRATEAATFLRNRSVARNTRLTLAEYLRLHHTTRTEPLSQELTDIVDAVIAGTIDDGAATA